MTGLADAQAILQAARDRGDTRTIGAALKAVRRATTAELRAEVAERKRRAEEAKAEPKRERSRRPFWWPFRRSR